MANSMRETKNSNVEWIGTIPLEWQSIAIKRISKIKTGSTPSKKFDEYYSVENGIPWIKPEDLDNFEPISKTEEYLTMVGAEEGTIFPPETVFVCCIASVGKVGYSNQVCSCNQQINGILFDNKKVFWKYGFYALKASLIEHLAKANQSVQYILNSTQQGYIKLPVPSIIEQHQIASYLDRKCAEIDDMIVKRQEIINKYDEYKKGIITHYVTKGFCKTNELEDNEITWIKQKPRKWKIAKMNKVAWLKGRIGWDGLKSSEFTDSGPYLITGTDFKDGFIDWETCAHITKERFDEDEDLHIQEDDLIITKDGTIGKVAIVKNCPEEVSLNSGVMIIRGNNNKYPYVKKYLYYTLLSNEFWSWYDYVKKPDSTIGHLYQQQFGEFKFVYPPIDEQEKISNYLDKRCKPIDEIIIKQQELIEKLKEYKQSIIYNAVTGKIDCRKEQDNA